MMRQMVELLAPHVEAIIGSHPHVTQGHYIYKDTLVATSLGNFLFPMHLTLHDVSFKYFTFLILIETLNSLELN